VDQVFFTITKEHLKLLPHLNIDSVKEGAEAEGMDFIYLDKRRPYGNSDVFKDMGDILQLKPKRPKGGWKIGEEIDFTEQQYDWMKKLHNEMRKVLQIMVVTGKAKAGTYMASDAYSDDWKLIKNKRSKS